jgi:quercetin dioxygenase-like cupin family protein
VDENELGYRSLDELANALEQHHRGPPAIELWQDHDPSQRFVAVFPVTDAQGAAASTVAYFIFDPGCHSGVHSDSAEEVIYVADGVGEVFVSGKRVELEAGEFVVVNEGVQHDVYAHGERELRLLSYFPAAVVESTFEDAVMPIASNVFSSKFAAPRVREIDVDELPPELEHLAGGGEEQPDR